MKTYGSSRVAIKSLNFLSSLMKVKQDFLRFGTFNIQSGSEVRFWEDIWL
jgi:hypothetical protein